MSATALKPLGLQTIRVHIDAIESAPPMAFASLPDYPDHPIRICSGLLGSWMVRLDPGTDFWIRGDVIGWPENSIEFQRHPATAIGVGDPATDTLT